MTIQWIPDEEAERVEPREVALSLLAELDLEAPELGVHPQGKDGVFSGIVGWNMWMWADPADEHQWGPASASETEGGVTVSLTARVQKVVWDMGNGDTVTCGKGSEWSEARTNGGQNIASPDCTYMYESRGNYTLTATASWLVEWTGGGESGVIPLELERERPYHVVEVQSVNVLPEK